MISGNTSIISLLQDLEFLRGFRSRNWTTCWKPASGQGGYRTGIIQEGDVDLYMYVIIQGRLT
jgi:hypothetical protein